MSTTIVFTYDCTPHFVYVACKFTGKERDTESGLDYFGARYYGSNMGRFSSPDPSGLYFADPTNPQSLNLYSYAAGGPGTQLGAPFIAPLSPAIEWAFAKRTALRQYLPQN